MIRILFFLIAGHALCDYPLQGDYLAKAKNPYRCDPPGEWWYHLFYHAIIHGAMVALVTGSLQLGLAETALHLLIDWLKCEEVFSGRVDQALHIAAKILWAALAASWGGGLV